MTTPKIIDNDRDEITVEIDGREIRGWSYHSDFDRCVKMMMAQEFAEGWYQAADAAAPDFADNAPRAIEMLRVAAAFIREHDPDGTYHYDEADCDGYCIADDCESAADILQGALAKAKGE